MRVFIEMTTFKRIHIGSRCTIYATKVTLGKTKLIWRTTNQKRRIIAWQRVLRITAPHCELQTFEVAPEDLAKHVVCRPVSDEEEVMSTAIVCQ